MDVTAEIESSHGHAIWERIQQDGLREAASIESTILAELAPELSMDSGDEDIQRQVQVKASLAMLLEKGRLAAVEGPVREQFETDLRALTDAEDDSKELKSAKRHLLFDRIVDTVELPFPVGPATVDGEGPTVKDALTKSYVKKASEAIYKDLVRKKIAIEKRRPDGRATDEIRPIECEVTVSPRAHGTGLFQRGQTQVLSLLTLGTAKEGQRIDDLSLETDRRFMHHYNFPPYSVGETGFMRGPKRRDIGHGALAQRALEAVIPSAEDFPYTIRIVSETLESNGSSSMGSVCGSTLALMDAGVPITAPVSGIAMGLVKEGDDYVILTDIQGAEDHLGDMDFKVAGTRDGITALQMDIKITGVTQEIMRGALDQANQARNFILDRMLEALPEARTELAAHAPRISSIQINPDFIGMVIGKGGETIRSLESEYDVQIDIEEDGTILVYATEGDQGGRGDRCDRGADQGTRGGGHLHRQGREDDAVRRLRRAEEGHRRPAPRLERGPGPGCAHRGRDGARRRGRRDRAGGGQGAWPDRPQARSQARGRTPRRAGGADRAGEERPAAASGGGAPAPRRRSRPRRGPRRD